MTVADPESTLVPSVAQLIDTLRPRANSLLVSVFGDSIMPRGGVIWLSDLVALMRSFGLSERLVRTGVYRLSQEGWFTSKSVGRRAQYSLSRDGLQKFAEAERRIYASTLAHNTGEWTLVQAAPHTSQADRQTLRRRLKWHGFGQLSTSLLVLPGSPPDSLAVELEQSGLGSKVLIFSSALSGAESGENMKTAAAAAWPLDELNSQYAFFHSVFENFANQRFSGLSGEEQFVLRTLAIHEYRKTLLKAPDLPAALLPTPWAGTAALQLMARIYKQTSTAADEHVTDRIADSTENAPALSDDYWLRFSGID